MPTSFRFLLDQNFPTPTFAVDELDQTVQFVHLSKFAPELARESTPDWLIYLVAARDGFDGVVTRDLEQIRDVDSLVVLSEVDLSVVTWATPIEDPITEWAQLLAYMPEVKKRVSEDRHRIMLIPAPRLSHQDQFHAPRDLLQKHVSIHRTSLSEVRSAALERMRGELRRRRKPDLLEVLKGSR